jgi:hypothetical protein
VAYVAEFAKNMLNYSEDGEVLHGAYGFRWREWFGFDQLKVLACHLREEPHSRRAVLGMWSPSGDLVASEGVGGITNKDVPCNTHCYFDLRGGALNMSVMCRSNDAVWGAYGANAVHFAFLMEYMAMLLRKPVGTFYQYSFNLHLYTVKFDQAWQERVGLGPELNHYGFDMVKPFPMKGEGESAEDWDADLGLLLASRKEAELRANDYYCDFFNLVVGPLLLAHHAYRRRDFKEAHRQVALCAALDWQRACHEWLERREK